MSYLVTGLILHDSFLIATTFITFIAQAARALDSGSLSDAHEARRPLQPRSRPSHDAPLNRGATAKPRRVVKNSRTNRLKRLTGPNRPGIKLPEGNFHTKHFHLLRKSPSTREAYHPDTTVSRM